ncbi:epoxide hydrolase family protein [Actinoplanes sp. NPDC049265]|uniref:epoxide hydrolase family protein n=1 Tax=Actinoplanes sp. NPDC049265 TaxID=3363902 RepID=UPI00372146B3
MTTIEPFRLRISNDRIAELRNRLRWTRWPEPATAPGWGQGPPLDYVRELCRYWADEYDWRATEARLAAVPQFRTTIGGLGIHFWHVRSARPDAIPLIMTHGWPGSVIEFEKVLGPLSEHFHVVCPSLPGYGFSDRPAGRGWTVERIADAWTELMTRLGYGWFIAQGHDWGTSISTEIGKRRPDRVIGLHLMPPLAPPDPATAGDRTPAEQAAAAALTSASIGDGYSLEQSTRPQTIGYGLVDSPALLCAWIIEKFQAWTDCDGDLQSVLTRDELIDNLMHYWLPGTGASAARLYAESFASVQSRFRGGVADSIDVPTGCSIFPKENPRPSRRWAERRFTNIRYWSEPPRGGHFAAFEQPALFTAEVIACARALTADIPSS